MELIIHTPTEDQFVTAIEFNFEELKDHLQASLEKYQGIIYTDDSIKDAKADRARLNKLKTAFDDRRKEIKKKCLAPYEAFEAKIKELVGMVDRPVLAIDSQVKSYENMKKEERRVQLEKLYNKTFSDIATLIAFDLVLDPRWLNLSTTYEKAATELIAKYQEICKGLDFIKENGGEYKASLKAFYIEHGLDIIKTMEEKRRIDELFIRDCQQREENDRRAKEQESRNAAIVAKVEESNRDKPQNNVLKKFEVAYSVKGSFKAHVELEVEAANIEDAEIKARDMDIDYKDNIYSMWIDDNDYTVEEIE